jgi:hemerythrin
MAVFEWHDGLLTGITQIDEHHRHLVGLLNATYRDFLRHAPPELLNELFEELIDYATYHFAAEEQLMAESGYPQIEEHRLEHAGFIKQVNEMHGSFQEKQKPFFLEILAFLQSWLESHIVQTDGSLGRFLALQPQESTGK